MRYFYLFLLTGLVGLTAYAIVAWPRPAEQTIGGQEISLANLPERYCPEQAELLYASNVTAAITVPVTNCRSINVATVNLGERDTVYVLLPRALPLSISYSKEVARYVVSPRVGDVTGDNVINEQDEAVVSDNLFTTATAGDIDLDGQVTSEDLALVRLNYGVGENRPDGKAWR